MRHGGPSGRRFLLRGEFGTRRIPNWVVATDAKIAGKTVTVVETPFFVKVGAAVTTK